MTSKTAFYRWAKSAVPFTVVCDPNDVLFIEEGLRHDIPNSVYIKPVRSTSSTNVFSVTEFGRERHFFTVKDTWEFVTAIQRDFQCPLT